MTFFSQVEERSIYRSYEVRIGVLQLGSVILIMMSGSWWFLSLGGSLRTWLRLWEENKIEDTTELPVNVTNK